MQLVLVQTVVTGLPDELAADLLVRPAHFDVDRLRFHRATIGIAQQGVEQHSLARAIEVARAEHEELQRVGHRAGDVELGQVQGRAAEVEQAGLLALAGQHHGGLVRQWQFGVAGVVSLGAGQHLAVAAEQFDLHALQRLAAFQGLGEGVQAAVVAVHGQADVAQGEQGRRLRIVVGAGLAHHRQVHAGLLERRQAGDRQQQGLAGVARRVEVEAAAVDQFGHRQQLARLPGVQVGAAPPLGEEVGQRLLLDAEELDVDLVDVQRDHRQALGQAGRQQRAAAGEADAGLQVAGVEAGVVLGGQFAAVDRPQARVDGQHQAAPRLQMAQAQLHQVVGEFPGAIDLAGLLVHQVQPGGEILLRVQRHAEAHRQGAGAIQLNFRGIRHGQFTAGIALGQLGLVQRRAGRLLLRGRLAGGGGGRLGSGGIAGAQQSERGGQKQSFVRHGELSEA